MSNQLDKVGEKEFKIEAWKVELVGKFFSNEENITGNQSVSSIVPPCSPVPTVLPKVSSDRGNCVSIILKSSHLSPKRVRQTSVLKNQKLVSELVTGYSLKYSHASSPGVQVRLDYCFYQPEVSRKFFKSACSLGQGLSSPSMMSCIRLSEEEMGYQHLPVLY